MRSRAHAPPAPDSQARVCRQHRPPPPPPERARKPVEGRCSPGHGGRSPQTGSKPEKDNRALLALPPTVWPSPPALSPAGLGLGRCPRTHCPPAADLPHGVSVTVVCLVNRPRLPHPTLGCVTPALPWGDTLRAGLPAVPGGAPLVERIIAEITRWDLWKLRERWRAVCRCRKTPSHTAPHRPADSAGARATGPWKVLRAVSRP